jgi:hypothetical protein
MIGGGTNVRLERTEDKKCVARGAWDGKREGWSISKFPLTPAPLPEGEGSKKVPVALPSAGGRRDVSEANETSA